MNSNKSTARWAPATSPTRIFRTPSAISIGGRPDRRKLLGPIPIPDSYIPPPVPETALDGYGTVDQRELMQALALAQGQIKPAVKSSSNDHFHTSYADLKEIAEAARGALSSNQIAWTQMLRYTPEEIWLETKLYHGPSGQWAMMRYPIQNQAKANSQALVGAVTYAKRASLAMAVGIVSEDEDDDGETEQELTGQRGQPQQQDEPPRETTAQAKAKTWVDTAVRIINNMPYAEKLIAWQENNQDNLSKILKIAPDEHNKVMVAMQAADERFAPAEGGE